MTDETIEVTYETFGTSYGVQKLLDSLPDTVGLDFEAASIFSAEQRKRMQTTLDSLDKDTDFEQYIDLRSKIASSALTHPQYVVVTHLVIAVSETKSYVIVVTSRRIEDIIMKWLVTTDRLQIWHNLSFDGRIIHHRTGLLPKNYEDTQIFAKTIINHVEVYKAKTGLKELAGAKYGDWGISADNFVATNLWDKTVLDYAAIDGPATIWVFNSIKRHIAETKEEADEHS